MSWEPDPLWTKSRLFFERAFREHDEHASFGLWCSLALEVLIRAALASISPLLLAAPDKNEPKNVLHALGRGDSATAKSILITEAINLCQHVFDGKFTAADAVAARNLINLRNEELHSGSAPFERMPPRTWLPAFWRACKNLCVAMNETLESLLDVDRAGVIEQLLVDTERDVKSKVMSAIAKHAKSFASRPPNEIAELVAAAKQNMVRLVRQHHHQVICPACKSPATVEGDPFGGERVEHADEETIIVRRSVAPKQFSCSVCDLSLTGYAELNVADLGGFYTRTSYFTPEEYYDFDPDARLNEYLREAHDEYDNE